MKPKLRCEVCDKLHVVESLARDCCYEWKENDEDSVEADA